MCDDPNISSESATPTGLLLVISGPSGVGKDTVWRAASPCLPTFTKAITCTTRTQRPGEVHGVSYFFVSDAEFDRLIRENQLLEWAHVHNARYGVPAGPVLDRLNQGEDVVCVIDVQGAQKIRSLFTNALLVFLKPPEGRESDVLKERIEQRGSIAADELESRLNKAYWELTHIPLYDHQIVNDEVQNAARQLCEIVAQEQQKRAR